MKEGNVGIDRYVISMLIEILVLLAFALPGLLLLLFL